MVPLVEQRPAAHRRSREFPAVPTRPVARYSLCMDDPVALLRYVVERLEGAGIEYMVSGSVALHFYGTPRMTRDLDIVASLLPAQVNLLVQLFEADCYIAEDAVRDAVRRGRMFNVIHNTLLEKVDFVVRQDTPFRLEEMRRRCRMRAGDLEAWVVSPEDLVLSKLVWAKDSGSEQQARDVATILRSTTDLDREYLMRWALDLGVSEALSALLA